MTADCDPLLPTALLWAALVHNYCVLVIGTLGKGLPPLLVEATRHSTVSLNAM